MEKENGKQEKNNKSHQVNTRLTEEEYQMLSSKSKEAGLKNSDYVRRVISDSKVEVRWDGPKVLHRMYEVQDNANKAYNMIMERIRVDEQRIDSLEELKDVKLIEPPFRIKLEDVACDLAEIKKDTVEVKMKVDKELTDCVDF